MGTAPGRARLGLHRLAERVGRARCDPGPAGDLCRGICARRGARPGQPHRHRTGRAHPAGIRYRRAEGAVPARYRGGAHDFLPGLFRAQCRVRPRLGAHQGAARAGRMGGQRAEDLDQSGAHFRLDLCRHPHRGRIEGAQGADVPDDAVEPAGDRGARDHPDQRRCRIQRNVLHRCALPRKQPDRRGGRRLEDCTRCRGCPRPESPRRAPTAKRAIR